MDSNVKKDTYISIITSTVSVAASRVSGVASISSEAGSIMNRLNLSNSNKSIEVEINQNNLVTITISINAYYGYKIPTLTCELQELIKAEVEKTTFYKVKAVNVNIVGVVFPS